MRKRMLIKMKKMMKRKKKILFQIRNLKVKIKVKKKELFKHKYWKLNKNSRMLNRK